MRLRAGASVWFNAVLRADEEWIEIGAGQQRAGRQCHPLEPGQPAILGRDVTVGHLVMLHSCLVGDETLIGNGAIVLDRARIGRNCLIAAGALVTPDAVIPDGAVIMGVPGRIVRTVTAADLQLIHYSAENYQRAHAPLPRGTALRGRRAMSAAVPRNLRLAAAASFLGHAPHWYKAGVILALLVNVALWYVVGPVVAAWALVLEFIVTLALALKSYPLAPGGLLAIEAVLLGLTTPEQVYDETQQGLPIILLLLFMVSAIAFMQELLVWYLPGLLTASALAHGAGAEFLRGRRAAVGVSRCADRHRGRHDGGGGLLPHLFHGRVRAGARG